MRVRIASTKATQKITKAMQMVAASKLRRAQAAAEAARPYAERMEKVLGNIAASVGDAAPSFVLSTADGRTISLEQLRGRIVVHPFGAVQRRRGIARSADTAGRNRQ